MCLHSSAVVPHTVNILTHSLSHRSINFAFIIKQILACFYSAAAKMLLRRLIQPAVVCHPSISIREKPFHFRFYCFLPKNTVKTHKMLLHALYSGLQMFINSISYHIHSITPPNPRSWVFLEFVCFLCLSLFLVFSFWINVSIYLYSMEIAKNNNNEKQCSTLCNF